MSKSQDPQQLSGDLGRESLESVLRGLAARGETGVLEVTVEGRKTTLEITAGALSAARASDDEGVAALGHVADATMGSFIFHSRPTGPANLRGTLEEVLRAARAAAAERARTDSPQTSVFAYHYLPPGVEPAQLEIEKPAQKTSSLLNRLGFGRELSAIDVPPPPELAAFANELAAEFRVRAAADAVSRRTTLETFSVPVASRLERVYASDPVGHRLPLREGRIDAESLVGNDHATSDVLRYLALLLVDLRDAAEHAWGKTEAEQIYDAVAHRVLGRALLTEPKDIVRHTRPQVRGRITVRIGGTGSYDLAQRTYVLGRVPSCDIVLVDATVSNRHARLTPNLDGFVIADLGSTNGTSVNGERLTGDRILRGGEVLRLGDATLLFERLN